MSDYNAPIIEEFRANAGKVGGPFAHLGLLLVTHTGAKTGAKRTNPVAYLEDDGRYAIFASAGGGPKNPDWYYNLKANPDAVVELGTETFPVRARVAEGEERDRLYNRQKELHPQFAEYERKTSRTIPVVVLERV